MKRSSACDALVIKFEGYHKRLPNDSCEAYPDVATGDEPWTIGYGTTYYQRAGKLKYGRTKVRAGDTLTRAEAEQELDAELDQIEDALAKAITAHVTQSMFDALCSFAFNVGLAGSAQQIARINARAYEECARSFDLYINAIGRPFQGLINRRNEEKALFRKDGLNPSTPAPKPAPVSTGRPYAPCPVSLHSSVYAYQSLKLGDQTEGVYWLQCALIGLGYLRKPADGELVGDVFNEHVEYAVKRLQDRHMGNGYADGIVGPKTRMAIEAALTRARAPKSPVDNSVATLTATGGKYEDGRWAGMLQLILTIGKERFYVCSGQKRAQKLRKPEDPRSYPGNAEPLPQGFYRIERTEWAGREGDYRASHGEGLGPVWIGLTAKFSDDRSAFGIHGDYGAIGTLGCVGVDVGDLRAVVEALDKAKSEVLHVDWKL